MSKLITINEICGALAMWVCKQHPFHSVEHVDSANQKLRSFTKEWTGAPDLPMKEFKDSYEIEKFLWEVLHNSLEILSWNSRKNGNESPISISSRYGKPAPEDDFIDIDALFRNVSRQAWYDAEDLTTPNNG